MGAAAGGVALEGSGVRVLVTCLKPSLSHSGTRPLTLVLPVVVDPNPHLALLDRHPVVDPAVRVAGAGREVGAEGRGGAVADAALADALHVGATAECQLVGGLEDKVGLWGEDNLEEACGWEGWGVGLVLEGFGQLGVLFVEYRV